MRLMGPFVQPIAWNVIYSSICFSLYFKKIEHKNNDEPFEHVFVRKSDKVVVNQTVEMIFLMLLF